MRRRRNWSGLAQHKVACGAPSRVNFSTRGGSPASNNGHGGGPKRGGGGCDDVGLRLLSERMGERGLQTWDCAALHLGVRARRRFTGDSHASRLRRGDDPHHVAHPRRRGRDVVAVEGEVGSLMDPSHRAPRLKPAAAVMLSQW